MAKVAFTAGRVAAFACPKDKAQAFLWDSGAPGLGLRVTPSGKPAYVFQGPFQGKDVRITIGGPAAWSIDQARTKARELQRLIDEGRDPRDLKRSAAAAITAREAKDAAHAISAGEAWAVYMQEGRPKRKAAFKPRYLADLKRMAAAGGEAKKRGGGTTRPGPLFPLMAKPLIDITEDVMQAWFEAEAKSGEHQAARALMMWRGFARWCASRPAYRGLLNVEAAKAPAILDSLPANEKRTDALESAQVAGWWEGVAQLPNPTASVYLRVLLLTGARREELAALKWGDISVRWNKLTVADKVGSTRTIPLTPYVRQLLTSLPRSAASDFVFVSTGRTGRIADARSSHARALEGAGIGHLTMHGLRRSFALLGEAAGAPAGAIAQVMGHRPSATHEGYKPRSVDALRPYLEQIESHILSMAGAQIDPAAHQALRAVGSRHKAA